MRRGSIDLEVKNVTKVFHKSEQMLMAIEDVSFKVYEGEFLCIIGPSGCGKSTLLRIIAGLVEPTHGVVLFRGKTVIKPHPKISVVFQSFALLPWRTVFENVELGLKLRGVSKEERSKKATQYIHMVGLAGFENSYPNELSGGMKQRVGFARALVTDPEIVLLDEPFSALDEFTATSLRREALRLWRESGETFIMITHSIPEALELADRILVLTARPGKVNEVVDVDLPRPREKSSLEFLEYEERLFGLLRTELGR